MIAGDLASAARTVTLTAEAMEPGTEIFVIDSQFRKLDNGKGVDKLEIAVAPGVYSIKFTAGNAKREIIRPVFCDTRVVCPPLPFASPAPLKGSSSATFHAEHQKAAQTASKKVHLKLKGSYAPAPDNKAQIFIFVRDLVPGVPNDPGTDLALCDLETGDMIVDFSEQGQGGPPDFPYQCKGCTVALRPGGYRLRATSAALGHTEQVIVASHGWQTQVFLLRQSVDEANAAPAAARADLNGGALFMARLGSGWKGDATDTRLTELARQALYTRRARVVSEADLQTMLNGSRQNPMLGLYACHLLLLSSAPNFDLLDSVTDVLRSQTLLGKHSDVEALRLALPGGVEASQPFVVPPMLRRGGELLTEATAKRPDLVPEGSLAARAAPYVLSDGVWLVARNVPDLPAPPVVAPASERAHIFSANTASKTAPRPSFPTTPTFGALESGGRHGANRPRKNAAFAASALAADALGGVAAPGFVPRAIIFKPGTNGRERIQSADLSAARALIQKRFAEQKQAKPTAPVQPPPTSPQSFEAVLAQAAQAATMVVSRAQKKIARTDANKANGDENYTQAEQAAWQAQKAVREVSRAYHLPSLEANLLGMLYGKESALSPADLIGTLRVPHATLQTAAASLSQTLSQPPPKKNA